MNRTTLRLELPTELLGNAIAHGWSAWPNETGGILLGHRTTHGYRANLLVGPGPGAVHARFNFAPDSEWQAQQVAERWKADPSLQYLGDWHTHPAGTTRLSRLDRATLRSIATYPEAQQPQPLMLILALGADGSCIPGGMSLSNGRIRRLKVTSLPL